MIVTLREHAPRIGSGCFVAPDAWLIGEVEIGDRVSIFFGAVLRGDILPIRVGSETNLQEHVMVHTTGGRAPAVIGSQVTVGHRAIVHGCRVGDRCLIGMGSIVLDEAVLEDECLIGAGAVIPEGMKVPSRSLVLGVPGKIVRKLGEDDIRGLKQAAAGYVRLGAEYQTLKLSSR